MADTKISALTSATTPLAGTEVLPIVQSGATDKVSVANLTAGRTVNMAGLNVGTANSQNSVFKAVVGSGGANEGLVIVPGSTGKGWLGFNNANNASIPGQVTYDFSTGQMGFRATGDYFFDVSNIKFGTAAKGINFTANTPAAGMTSQLLNWYEEGTFTPTYYGAAGSAGSLAYSEQTGKYTRIGRQVTVSGTIILTNKGSWTGRVQIGGLPYNSTVDQYTGNVELRNCTFTGNYVIMEIGRAASTFARFVIVNGAGANTEIDNTMVANNSGFLFTLTYFV
jgi:hypothetical protein